MTFVAVEKKRNPEIEAHPEMKKRLLCEVAYNKECYNIRKTFSHKPLDPQHLVTLVTVEKKVKKSRH